MIKPREFLLSIGATVNVSEASRILGVTPYIATRILSRWTKRGWFERVGQGIYVPNPIFSSGGVADEGFSVVPEIIGEEGYICGWSALSHHGVTEQIFIDISLASFKWTRYKVIRLKKSKCCIFKIKLQDLIGLEVLWYQDKKVFISDIHKTILDILVNPACGGGFAHVVDCFRSYFDSNDCNIDQILKYAKSLNVKGPFYKRLGYLLEIVGGDSLHIEYCYLRKTSGYLPLDPQIKEGKFCSRWKLIIPEYIKI